MSDKNPIARFFKKKKSDWKFKNAGPGHRLNEPSTPKAEKCGNPPSSSSKRLSPTAEAKQAAAAALARLDNNRFPPSFKKTSDVFSAEAMKKEVKKALMEDVEKQNPQSGKERKENEEEEILPSQLAATGVYFKCPIIGEEILTKAEWKTKIRDFLYEQLEYEKGLTACLIIVNCNKNTEKLKECKETLLKYLENVVRDPSEGKYRKIRMSNKTFQEKIVPFEGTLPLLEAAGFEKITEENGEDFLIMPPEKTDVDKLAVLTDGLLNAETIQLELDRNVRVFCAKNADIKIHLPPDFFSYTPEELKKEQKARMEAVENASLLRTQAMREKQEMKELKKYRYALIRVKFPNGTNLQGTFDVYEKFEKVWSFVKESVKRGLNFTLRMGLETLVLDENRGKTLLEMRLVPAVVLLFCSTGGEGSGEYDYLKEEISVLCE